MRGRSHGVVHHMHPEVRHGLVECGASIATAITVVTFKKLKCSNIENINMLSRSGSSVKK